MNTPSSTLTGPPEAPDFKQVRRYLRTIDQREALGRFMKARWTPAELAECARQMNLVPGQTKATAVSYRTLMDRGPEHTFTKEILRSLRAPGFVMPPFDRPVPKRFAWDEPDNPDHTSETRADVAEVARLYRNRQATQLDLPWPDANEPIQRWLWKRCYRLRNRYHSLDDTLDIQGLRRYATDPRVSFAADTPITTEAEQPGTNDTPTR